MIGDFSGSMGINIQGHWLRDPDCIGELDSASICEPGCYYIFGDMPGCVGRGTVHLRRILARECTTSVGTRAAVGVDDDLATGEPRVALGPTDLPLIFSSILI